MPTGLSVVLGGGELDGVLGWGVMDRLLEDTDIEITAISAAGSGCLSALAIAQGAQQGGSTGARERLGSLWQRIAGTWRQSIEDPEPWQLLMPLLAAS